MKYQNIVFLPILTVKAASNIAQEVQMRKINMIIVTAYYSSHHFTLGTCSTSNISNIAFSWIYCTQYSEWYPVTISTAKYVEEYILINRTLLT